MASIKLNINAQMYNYTDMLPLWNSRHYIVIPRINNIKGEIFRFFLKSEGKEIERTRKKGILGVGGGGGGYLLTYFWG